MCACVRACGRETPARRGMMCTLVSKVALCVCGVEEFDPAIPQRHIPVNTERHIAAQMECGLWNSHGAHAQSEVHIGAATHEPSRASGHIYQTASFRHFPQHETSISDLSSEVNVCGSAHWVNGITLHTFATFSLFLLFLLISLSCK